MSGLADLLADVAVEAKLYGDPERAVRVLRRRRRLARLTPLAIAVVILVAVPVTYVALHRQPAQMTPSGIVSWLPARLQPVADPPPLPAGRGVGRGSLVYVGSAYDRAVLVTADFAAYSLRIMPGSPLSLSPDGRWLLSTVDDRITLRDLTGTTVQFLFSLPDGPINVAWSADGRAFAIQAFNGTLMDVVDLESLASHQIGMPLRLCGARDDGTLLGCSAVGAPVSVTPVDARTGRPGSTVAADPSSALTPAEQQGADIAHGSGGVMVPLTGAGVVAVRTNVYQPQAGVTTPGDLLLFDAATGQFLGRIALPPERVGQTVPSSGGVAFMTPEGRVVQNGLPEGIPLVHIVPTGTPDHPYTSKVVGVEFVNPGTGARSEVMTVSDTVTRLVVRGGVSP